MGEMPGDSRNPVLAQPAVGMQEKEPQTFGRARAFAQLRAAPRLGCDKRGPGILCNRGGRIRGAADENGWLGLPLGQSLPQQFLQLGRMNGGG